MALIKFTNFGTSLLAVAPTGTGGLTFSVEAGKGALYPVLGVDEYFYGIFKDAAGNREIVKIEARSVDSFTIESGGRGFDGTSARTWLAGDVFSGALTRAAINEVIGNDALNAIGQLTPAADRLIYYTGPTAAALATITALARTLINGLTAAAMRITLGAVGTTGDESIAGTKTHVGLAPVAYSGAVDDANKVTLNVTEPTAANDLNLPDLSVIRLWNLPAGIGPIPYAGDTIPTGWLECDGTAVSRTTYASLFTAIDVLWGAGDGSTTFNLPDLDGRVAIGEGARSIADTGGEDTHTLTEDEMPSHSHSGRNTVGLQAAVSFGVITTTTGNSGSTGGDAAHNIMQPYAVTKMIISY